MSDHDIRPSRRVWSAGAINAQLDEVGDALVQGAGEFVKGFLFGAAPRRRHKPRSRPVRREPTAAQLRAAFPEWEITLSADGRWTATLTTSAEQPQPLVTAATLAALAEQINDLIAGDSS
jgi:hypothetical protein